MKLFKFTVNFDEIDTKNRSETFKVSAENEDTAWGLAECEAIKRGYKFGHRHEFTLELVESGTK